MQATNTPSSVSLSGTDYSLEAAGDQTQFPTRYHDEDGMLSSNKTTRRRDASVPVIARTSAGEGSVKNKPSSEWQTPVIEEVVVLPTETTPLISNESLTPNNEIESSDWWSELKTLSLYTLPVFGTHVLEYSLSIAPVVTTGHISTNALAAVTLSSMTASVTGWSIIVGFCTALDTMLPPAWTSRTPSLVGLWTMRMMVLMCFILVPIFVIWLNAEEILLLLRQDPDIAHLAGIYLRWYSLGMPAYAFNAILRRYFQSQGLFSAPTRVLFIVAPINALLCYLLVWGPSWIRLGFIGAPIATVISFNLITVCYVIYGAFIAPKTAWHPITKECLHSLGPLFKLGLAGVAQIAAEWWSWELVALAASQIGPTALAVQSVLLVSASTSYQAPYALGSAASVRVGNLLGARNAKGAALANRVALGLTVAVAFVLSAIFLIFRHRWAYMFNNDAKVARMVAHILPLVAFFQVFDGLSGVTEAILRTKGQQDLGAVLNLLGYYGIGIPVGLLLAFKFSFDLEGLWIGLTLAVILIGLLGLYICTIKTNWNTEVQKTMVRLGQEED